MANERGNAYGLTTLCPLLDDRDRNESLAAILRARLAALPLDERSPMARVPNTYLCRFFVLDEVRYQDRPALEDGLRSKYLVFVSEFHGKLDPYLRGMWDAARPAIEPLWEFCVAFKGEVTNADSFVRYIQRCQVTTTYYFDGSNDLPLAEQLKALYLKQEFAKFVCQHQGLGAAETKAAFLEFVQRAEPANLAGPTWRPGASSLDVAVVDGRGATR
jgi:hypothetical protein